MKKLKAMRVWMGIVLVCLSLGGCVGNKEEKENQKTEVPKEESVTQRPQETDTAKQQFEYEVETKNLGGEGITVQYPILVNTSDKTKADAINDLIQKDIDHVIEKIKADTDNTSGVTIDSNYNYANEFDHLLSIQYLGTRFVKEAAYPVAFNHTITLSIEEKAVIPLSDLFVIDEAFVQAFKLGNYAPYTKDLDLEVSGVNVVDLITQEYTEEELIDVFQKSDANYSMKGQGIILSIEVPHVVGDHLEMAVNYEALESNIKKEHPVWKDYMFLAK